MRTLLLISIILFSISAYGQKTSKKNTSKKSKTEVNSADEKYGEFIKLADAAYAQKEYSEAKNYYLQAVAIQPNATYAKDMLTKTQLLLDEQMKLEEEAQYKKVIQAADSSFVQRNYAKAKEYYNRAVMFMPSDPYPKQKLAEIEVLLNEQKAKEEKTFRINQLIKEGDELFASKQYTEANIKYNQVLALDATAFYPKQRISEIQTILASTDNGGQQKKMEYDKAIAEADSLLKLKEYQQARKSYEKAISLNAAVPYPMQRIVEIDKIMASMQAEQKKMKAYSDLIAKADELFLLKQYVEAKNVYDQAIALKPDMSYPKQKITEIERILSGK